MDYLDSLEFRMAALQRKIRILQDLRFFVETSSPEELASFGDELRAVFTSAGVSVGSVLGGLLGASRPAFPGGMADPSAGALAAAVAASRNAGAWQQTPGVAAPPHGGPPGPAAPVPANAASASSAQTIHESQAPSGATPAAAIPAQPQAIVPEAPVQASGEREEALGLIEAGMKRIPAGAFIMGSDASDQEKPTHKVSLSAYRICDHLATNREYALFLAANPGWGKDRADPELRDDSYLNDWSGDTPPEGKEDHPVAYVSWHAARAFAEWLGKRLPTEAEWECAARGGLVGKKYPGGDAMNDKLANLAKQFKGTTPVRQFPANGFGLYDMAGNLFEWCADWYGPYAGGEALDPKGPAEGEYRVVRGGSWMSGAGALRVSARVDMEDLTCGQVGIRLVD